MTTFERIKNLSKEKGFSLKQVAEKSGMSSNAIYRYNQGVKPKYDSLKAIAKTLNVSVEYLTGETSTTSKPTKVDIDDDDVIMTFEGRPIPPEDLELMKRLLRGGRNDK
ncbi:helix-turn-helix domain-containing protein [Companilactobacillus allii]|uniref:Transcriptional regulator n=1 Tax=Companilactobacillus allii TaxID=1847728 RepID=A0A1P8Q5K6_9LACO|nr:helix-turn-helix transcriptional regulator [Companilactobacillus allii]APX73142.1 transcriptional regulator [Companilactobacillus allii]USQ67946.1 helix-turn-helix domain-containing protein [Companilactobacillus allii]